MTLRLQTRYYSENAILADFRLQTLHYSIYRDLPTSDFLDTILFLLRLQTKSTLVRYVLSPAKESCSDLCNGPKFKIWMLDLRGVPTSAYKQRNLKWNYGVHAQPECVINIVTSNFIWRWFNQVKIYNVWCVWIWTSVTLLFQEGKGISSKRRRLLLFKVVIAYEWWL